MGGGEKDKVRSRRETKRLRITKGEGHAGRLEEAGGTDRERKGHGAGVGRGRIRCGSWGVRGMASAIIKEFGEHRGRAPTALGRVVVGVGWGWGGSKRLCGESGFCSKT